MRTQSTPRSTVLFGTAASTCKKHRKSRVRSLLVGSVAVLLLAPSLRSADDTWGANAASDWYTVTNWASGTAFPGLQGAAASNTNIATWTSDATATTFGIDMGTASLNLGAISIDSTRTIATSIGNSSATAGSLRLYGATVNGIANVILRNNSSALLTLQDTQVGSMGVTLSNPTDNIVNIDDAGGITIGGIISEAAAGTKLTKSGTGSGVLTLSGANTYSGLTTITGGILSVGTIADSGSSNLGITGGVTLNGGTLQYTAVGATTNITRTFSAANTSTASAIEIVDAGTTLNLTSSFAGNSAGTVTKKGAGALTLGGATDNSSLILNVAAGTLILNKVASTAAIHAVAGISDIASGATVRLSGTGGDQIFTGSTTGAFGLVAMSGGMLDLNGKTEGFARLTGTGTVTSSVAGAVTLTLGESNGAGSFGGVIQNGSGTVALTKTGTGTLTLTGANTHSGTTSINGGTLALSGGNNRLLSTGAVTFGGSATFDVGSTTQTLNTLSTSVGNFTQAITGSGGTINVTSTGTMILVASGTGSNQTSTMSIGNATVTFAPTSTVRLADQTGSNNATTTATLTLNAGATLNTGNLVLAFSDYTNGANSPSAVATVTINNGATLKAKALTMQSFDHQNNTKTATINVNTGGLFLLGTLSAGSSSSTTWTNNINFNGGTLQNYDSATDMTISALIGTTHPFTLGTTGTPTFDITSGRTGTINEPMIGAGSLTKIDTGTLVLGAANTYSGNTLVSGGTLRLSNNLALQNSTLDTSGAGVVTLTVTTPTLGGLSGSTALASVLTTGYSAVTSLTLNPGNGVTDTYTGNITNGAAGMALTKSGLGKQILGGTNSYTGATNVSAGTLLVNGSISGSTVSVTGGTLGGTNGTISATTIASGGTLAPGSSIGTLNFSSTLTLGGTSVFEINKTGSTLTADFANVTGTLTLGGTLNVTATGDTLVEGDTFNLFDAGAFTGSFATVNLPTLSSAYAWDTGSLSTAGIITVVPEPGSISALLGGLGLLLGLRRRKSFSHSGIK